VILNYALTLELLERKFYADAVAKFTAADFPGLGDDFYPSLVATAKDEATHVSFLTAALTAAGATPVQECVYSFPYTDGPSFVGLAAAIEGVGEAAYLGAAAAITVPGYLTAAGSILTIESRHSSYFRGRLGLVPIPKPFAAPMTPMEVVTLAAAFIVSCPQPVGVATYPMLALTTAGAVTTGETIEVDSVGPTKPVVPEGPLYAAFLTILGPVFSPATATETGFSFVVPAGLVKGESFVVISTSGTAITDEDIIAGPAIVEVTGYLADL
jgi:hypothetical protein